MLQQLFARLFRGKQCSDEDVLDACGAILEVAGIYEPLSRLPASKERIKRAIISRAKDATERDKQALLGAYLSLANFQDSTLAGVSMSDARTVSEKSGDELVQEVLKLGPQIKNMAILNDLVTLERRILAQEWEQAEVSNILSQKAAHE